MFTLDRFFFRIWAGWFLTLVISIMVFGIGPSFLVIPVAIGSALTFLWCLRCAYQSESFSYFASLRLWFSIGMGPMIAFAISHMVLHGLRGFHWAQSFLISILPFAFVVLMYMFFHFGKGGRDVFILQGKRVDVHEPQPNNPWLLAGVSAGLSGMLYSAMQEHGIPMESLVFLMIGASLYHVFYLRDRIYSLRRLKERERREKCLYTFQSIEYIRELRQASFLGRLFAPKNKKLTQTPHP